MVLTRSFLAALLLLLSACVTPRPVVPSRENAAVATAFVVDADETLAVRSVPDAVATRFAAPLSTRNLRPAPVAEADWSRPFEMRRSTASRLMTLAASTEAPYVVLVETRASFYSLLTGRYRWTVRAQLSIAHKSDPSGALSRNIDLPVYQDFDHQREDAVLLAAAPSIAEELGRLVDDFLGMQSAPIPSSALHGRDAIYFVMIDRFKNGDHTNDADAVPQDPEAFHGGDLQGVLDGLDDLHRMGVTTLWLSPVFATQSSKFMGHGAYHGYWVEDFSRIEPRFGDEALLRRLSDEVHRRGMKLLLDVVLNHVAYDSPLVAQKPGWFHHQGSITNWSDRRELEQGDVHGLPDLAQENEEVFAYLVAQSNRWIDAVHPDGFRLDAVKHVPISFWARYNDAIRQHAGPSFILLGEDLDGNPAQLARTLVDGRFSSLFNFPLYFATVDVFCRGAHPGRIGAVLEAQGARTGPLPYVNLVDNHDLPRIASACGGDLSRAKAALEFMLLAPGTPSITWGTEQAMLGAGEPGNRADYAGQGAWTSVVQDDLETRRSLPDGPISFARLDEGSLEIERGSTAMHLGPGSFSLSPAGGPSSAPIARGTTLRLEALPEGVDEVRITGLGANLGDWSFEAGTAFLPSGGGLEADAPMPVGGIFQFKLVGRTKGQELWETRADRFLLTDGGPVGLAWNG